MKKDKSYRLTTKDLAEQYATSENFWRRAAKEKNLKHRKLGVEFRFCEKDVEDWFKQRENAS